MARSRLIKVACVVLMCMVVVSPHAEATISCDQVTSSVNPCISYVLFGGSVPTACCNGIISLLNAAITTADRQTVCSCLKSAISGVVYTSYNLDLASGLPAKCEVSIPYEISPSTDCTSVQ